MIRELQWKLLDNYRRKLFLKYELRKLFFNNVLQNSRTPVVYKYLALYRKSRIVRLGSKTKVQNRCVISGRSWSVKKYSKYSRFVFRNESYNGSIPGISRASW